MWLGIRQAARDKYRGRGRNPGGAVSVNPTTVEDLADYDRLRQKFPDVESPKYDTYGLPDQVAHLELLRDLERQESVEAPAGPPVRGTAVVDTLVPAGEISNKPALMRRVPGQDLANNPPPPMKGRDLPHRTPRDWEAGGYTPPQQSIEDWVQTMRNKGIRLDHTLQRPDAARPVDNTPQPYRPLRGREIWPPLTTPGDGASLDEPTMEETLLNRGLRDLPASGGELEGFGRSWKQKARDLFRGRKASTEVVDYIQDVLAKVAENE